MEHLQEIDNTTESRALIQVKVVEVGRLISELQVSGQKLQKEKNY